MKYKKLGNILITLDNSVFVFGQDQRIGTGSTKFTGFLNKEYKNSTLIKQNFKVQ
jgi:pyruvate/2-oxoglutarate/acetoin dehydrogenase E1 component